MGAATDAVIKLFHLDQDALRCPYPLFEGLRAEGAPRYFPDIECYLVTRYEDIVKIARHPEQFSSMVPTGPVLARQMMETMQSVLADDPELAGRVFSRPGGQVRVLLNADPPDHGRQRKIVNRAFTPPKVKALEPRITQIADELIDAFIDKGEVELVHQFGVLLPLTVIAECLGVPKGPELATFKRWSDDFVAAIGNHTMTTEQLKSLLTSQLEFFEYFSEKIVERRANPQNDLISDVVHSLLDGEPLSDPEMLAMFSQFLVAGNETTTKLIASGMLTLIRNPEVADRLRADPSLTAGFVEEALRLEAPVQGLYRTSLVDTEIGGVAIPAGSHLMLVYASGNYDEDVFEDAGTVDPCRSNAMRHLAFGHGEHYCLGAALARAEGRIAFERLLARLDDIRLADDESLDYEPSYVLHGLKHLNLTFTKRG